MLTSNSAEFRSGEGGGQLLGYGHGARSEALAHFGRMREYNLPLATIVQRLRTLALVDGQTIVNARVAITTQPSPASEKLVVAHYTVGVDRPIVRIDLKYDGLRLANESFSIDVLYQRLIQAAQSGVFECIAGFSTKINNTGSAALFPSDDPSTSAKPKYEIQISANDRGQLGQTGPLLAYGQPSFESTQQAVRAWISPTPLSGLNDASLGSVVIDAPIAGPHFGALEADDAGLRVAVERMSSTTTVELSGVWQSSNAASIEPFAQKVAETPIVIPRPAWADQVALWLVRSDSIPVDFFTENSTHCSRSRRVLFPPSAQPNESASARLAQIRAGEGEDVEFKPFIDPASEKFVELIKTVIAFANKRGGTIYLGVSDEQEIDGVETALRKAAPAEKKDPIEECTKWYCGIARKMVCDRVSTNVDFRVEPIHLSGQLLFLVTVDELKNKPCAETKKNEIWIRKGATNARATPEDWRLLFTEKKGSTDIWGQMMT